MKKSHAVWLEFHPGRSVDWLRARLDDGFDIHHIDGDRGNNIPSNLVLIEHGDHLDLHGLALRRKPGPRGPRKETLRLGAQAAPWANRYGYNWAALGRKYGTTGERIKYAVEKFKEHGFP